ncbi:MAG TPA: hypothetical protein VK151_17855 [Fluviicola sp.]|nr:hypothetical protein [Fluviicola sp.]
MKYVFRIFLFLAISSFCMEIAYSLAGETAIELASSDNTDDEEDSDDPCDKNEEKSGKENLFFDCSTISTPVFTGRSIRTLYAEMNYPIAFHLIEPPYSPPEMI